MVSFLFRRTYNFKRSLFSVNYVYLNNQYKHNNRKIIVHSPFISLHSLLPSYSSHHFPSPSTCIIHEVYNSPSFSSLFFAHYFTLLSILSVEIMFLLLLLMYCCLIQRNRQGALAKINGKGNLI